MPDDGSDSDNEEDNGSFEDGNEALGGTSQKGFTGGEDGELGAEGGYGFIPASAEGSDSDGSSDSGSDSE